MVESNIANKTLRILGTSQFDSLTRFIGMYVREYGSVDTYDQENAVKSVFLAYKYVNELLTSRPSLFVFKETARNGFEERGNGFREFVRYNATKEAEERGYRNITAIMGGLSQRRLENGAREFVDLVRETLGENGEKLLKDLGLRLP